MWPRIKDAIESRDSSSDLTQNFHIHIQISFNNYFNTFSEIELRFFNQN